MHLKQKAGPWGLRTTSPAKVSAPSWTEAAEWQSSEWTLAQESGLFKRKPCGGNTHSWGSSSVLQHCVSHRLFSLTLRNTRAIKTPPFPWSGDPSQSESEYRIILKCVWRCSVLPPSKHNSNHYFQSYNNKRLDKLKVNNFTSSHQRTMCRVNTTPKFWRDRWIQSHSRNVITQNRNKSQRAPWTGVQFER